MPKGTHRITKANAARLMDGMKNRISKTDSPLYGFPEGFSFDVEAVRKLINHPEAAYFIIRFGWKEEEKEIAPILCVADKSKKVLEEGAGNTAISSTRSIVRDAANEPETDEEAGGFLDEGNKFP